ncbi:NAD(P)/FAD-dependent oxidoreductase [Kocuria sp.]|uniref:NAD(P)/FAD-dependent oxidoreductase n=1 Tax=Kocuria sp. TaxID=1871328 RepID=UPI0026DFFD63|nr:FAD-dependent oxidoreductase [Kocuria sp.]MDO5617614.1 FAD-dependent oxidoreductase [Kocuria sp.]
MEAQIVVIGGGIAGLSLVSELSRRRSTGHGIVLVEAEDTLAHHTSARSAQHLSPSYGPPAVRELTHRTVAQLSKGLEGLDQPVVWQCPTVVIGSHRELTAESTFGSTAIDRASVLDLCPELSPLPREALEGGLYENDAVRLDAPSLLDWHRRIATESGVEILTGNRVTGATFADGTWEITAGTIHLRAPLVVNAAGAWGDQVATSFGVDPLGLQPLRRTAALVELNAPLDPEHPVVVMANGGWYYRQDAVGALISSGEAEPEEPCDAQPHPGQVEELVAELNSLTDLGITGIIRSWTGQRTAAPDGVPVCGFDPAVQGFLWLVGQSGYGFQTSTALARAAADLLLENLIGSWCSVETARALDPARFSDSA